MYQREIIKDDKDFLEYIWQGPARITGFEDEVVWLNDSGLPVCGAPHLIKPSSVVELMLTLVKARNHPPSTAESPIRTVGEQQRYVGLSACKHSVGSPPTENKGASSAPGVCYNTKNQSM